MEHYTSRPNSSNESDEPNRSTIAILGKAIDAARQSGQFGLRLPHDHRTALALAAAGADVVLNRDQGIAHVTIRDRTIHDMIDFKSLRDQETSFRRGFNHGAQYAVDGLRAGATSRELTDWLGRIHAWRFNRADGEHLPPEVWTAAREGR